MRRLFGVAENPGAGVELRRDDDPARLGIGCRAGRGADALATIPPSPHTANPVALQNEPVVEFDRTHNPLRDELLCEKFALDQGALLVPQAPGLGLNVNDDMVSRYRTER
jgi:D-galactarolactone cycloisomerase